ncbi:hypothetical protein [Tenacibaculum amylolyticum]|uniref:hypothetical protein n=1 Tax=Tenacibaculum amylolyticum TaxID=104269 RepID=UPI0038958F56
MKKIGIIVTFIILTSCTNYSQVNSVISLPKKLKEVSGVEMVASNPNLLWMHNDSGNKSKLYQVNLEGKVEKTVTINAKNIDWEDITSDEEGNIYLADFGNNANTRKELVILKLNGNDLITKKAIDPVKIRFTYPDQKKFPPKKKHRFFDAESLLYLNGDLYIFTKSRVKGVYGKTSLYKIPAKEGTYVAEYIDTYENCHKMHCWITAASISPDHKKVALLTHNKVLVFSNFPSNNFFKGTLQTYDLGFDSQKEGIDFKDNNTLYITDERSHGNGGNLYEFSLKK